MTAAFWSQVDPEGVRLIGPPMSSLEQGHCSGQNGGRGGRRMIGCGPPPPSHGLQALPTWHLRLPDPPVPEAEHISELHTTWH